MKQVKLTDANIGRTAGGVLLVGKLVSHYDRPLRSFVLHYQYLNAQNRILGGGNEWMTEPLEPGKAFPFRSEIAVPVKNAAKMVWSLDFDARELVTDEEVE